MIPARREHLKGAAARRLRLLRLQAAAALADWLAAALGAGRPALPGPMESAAPGEGISVIIPERAAPDLLDRCLQAARASTSRLEEPSEILVVASAAPPSVCAELVRRHPGVTWIHSTEPLAFSEAVDRGLRRAQYPWVYLLNSDMFLAPDALLEAGRWRSAGVFAVASQISVEDARSRREETGWTDLKLVDGLVQIFDAAPGDATTTRGSLYAGGGSSLYRRELLLRFIRRSAAYAPFYWEDVEWGALAWGLGFETLFCPLSRATHIRRATVSRLYDDGEVDRIFRRNALQFQLRNLKDLGSLERVWERLVNTDAATFREVTRWRNSTRVFKSRLALRNRRFGEGSLADAAHQILARCPATPTDRPSAVVVTPFALYPPAHGGALRTVRLAEGLAGRVCVTTHDGARGFLEAEFRSLLPVETISGFVGPLEQLLTDTRYRLSLEAPDEGKLAQYRWEASARRLLDCYRGWVR